MGRQSSLKSIRSSLENSINLEHSFVNNNDDDDDDDDKYAARSLHSLELSEDDFGLDADNNEQQQGQQRQQKKNEAPPAIAKTETRAVRGLKLLVLAVLFCSMVLVAMGVYLYTKNSEEASFQEQFDDDAHKVLDALGVSLAMSLGAVDALVVSIVSHANATNQTWPFVTIPDFAVRASKIRSLSNAVYLGLYPHVQPTQRAAWENYSATHNEWVAESIAVQALDVNYLGPILWDFENFDVIHTYENLEMCNPEVDIFGTASKGPYLPFWQSSPVIPVYPVYNWDLYSVSGLTYHTAIETHRVGISEAYLIPGRQDDPAKLEEDIDEAEWIKDFIPPEDEPMEPISDIIYPIIADLAAKRVGVMTSKNETDDADYIPSEHEFVGFLSLSIYWRDLIRGILPPGSNGIVVVFENKCNPTFTYQIDGPLVEFLGVGDLHNDVYNEMEKSSWLYDLKDYSIKGNHSNKSPYSGIPIQENVCPFFIRVFPSDTMHNQYATSNPVVFAIVAIFIFALSACIFIIYDCFVEKRQHVVLTSAVESNAIVSSLFPSMVRDRIARANTNNDAIVANTPKRRLKNMMMGKAPSSEENAQKNESPIAEVFSDTTIIFADIAGFTAWSSVREPSQVFVLLETLYGAFDDIAQRRGVFKIETIGDCYLACTGLPEPQANHALIMARFAMSCRSKFRRITRDLEVTLGPGTAELRLRAGLHSGTVTAGVLRGHKSRFQLFGDTVNTAARMESNSKPDKIQLSSKTADLLVAGGKSHWLIPREDKIVAKGKGEMQTYWLDPSSGRKCHSSFTDSMDDTEHGDHTDFEHSVTDLQMHSDATERLIEWNVTIFEDLLKNIVAHRQVFRGRQPLLRNIKSLDSSKNVAASIKATAKSTRHLTPKTAREEVANILTFPKFDMASPRRGSLVATNSASNVELPEVVLSQLRSLIMAIAASYQENNAFHNFEHACHVTMSTKKLLDLIRKEEEILMCKSTRDNRAPTFGITSDPLTVFAVVFSSIVNDMSHPGVSNAALVSSKDLLAARYKNKSPAESNSFDVAWNIFMESSYDNLRACICSNDSAELDRFRQLLVQMTIATDLFDPELQSFRDGRWNSAFGKKDEAPLPLSSSHSSSPRKEDASKKLNLQRTVLLEYIVQASDIVHTMQHFSIYQKWNQKMFEEEYDAFRAGRLDQDPSEGWYENELHFYDTYVIPLVKKLQKSGVFLDSTTACCGTFLEFAADNRQEWETKGREIVGQMLKVCLQKKDVENSNLDSFQLARNDSATSADEAFEELLRLQVRGVAIRV